MPNPWLKKNPFMSAWLSTANRMAGTLRGQPTAQAKRQLSAALAKAATESLEPWFAPTSPSAAKARPKRRR